MYKDDTNRYDLLLEKTQKHQLNRLIPAHIYDMTTIWGQLSLSAFRGRYISSKLQLHVGHHNQWRRHLANAYEVWCNLQVKLCDPSIPEHTEGEVFTKWCYTIPFLSFMIRLWYSYITAMRSYDFVVAPMTNYDTSYENPTTENKLTDWFFMIPHSMTSTTQ